MSERKKVIFLGADHAGFEVKEKVKKQLLKRYNLFDLSKKKEENDDYTDSAFKVGEIVRTHPQSKGILFCGSGEGMCIAANKVKGIRAVAPESVYTAIMSRVDNDSNVLCISGRNGKIANKINIVKKWLETDFSNEERHMRRVEKIKNYENKNE